MTPQDIEFLRDSFIEYTKTFEGTPYRWAGDDFSGFDCSGLIVEVCKSVGILARGGDYTGEALRQLLSAYIVPTPYKGCLVFFIRDGKAYHVEVCINKYQTIGASGGNNKVKTVQDAIRENAFIKRRPIPQTSNLVFIDPFQVFT